MPGRATGIESTPPTPPACAATRPCNDNATVTLPAKPMVLFDFTDPAAVDAWAPIDDRVMGGVSHSRLRHDPAGHAVFEGQVSLDRGGGFASVRSSPGARGLPGAAVCLIELRAEPRRYKLSLFTDDGFDSLNYQAGFEPAQGGWHTLQLALAAFRASFRGRAVPGAPPLDPARIRQVGLMIAERQAGPFALDIRQLRLK